MSLNNVRPILSEQGISTQKSSQHPPSVVRKSKSTLKNEELIKQYADFKWKREDIKSWTKESFIKGLHLILAPTQSGKTIYASSILFSLLSSFPKKKFWIYQVGKTSDAMLSLIKIKTFLKTYNIDVRLSKCDKFVDCICQYNALISMHSNKNDNNILKEYFFVFYFDDISDDLYNKKNLQFWADYCSNFRHARITTIINTQNIKNIPSVIRDQTASFTIIGTQSNTNLNNSYENIPIVSERFPSNKEFRDFYQFVFRRLFNPYVTLIFRKNSKEFTTYKVSKQFIKMLDSIKITKEEVNIVSK